MAYDNPTINDFKTFFVRAFPFGTDLNTQVLDQDIANAYLMTNPQINQALFIDQSSYTLGYFNLSAHFLVTSLRASSQGLNGQFNWLEQSKAAGTVNQAFSIPQRILDNPYWAMLTKTNFGAAYLGLIFPQLAGQIYVVAGSTRP